MPFVRFRVLRALETGDLSDAEGRDRVIDELGDGAVADGPERRARGAARGSPPTGWTCRPSCSSSACRAAAARGRRALRRRGPRLRGLAAAAAPSHGAGGGRRADLGRREPTERSFLALCIALPRLGAAALAELDLEADLTSAATRRAAAHLREHLDAPTTGLADDDPLLGFMRELAVGDARTQAATPAAFEIERLQLTLARLDREIAAARAAASGDISKLAQRRWEAQAKLAHAVERAMDDHPAPR